MNTSTVPIEAYIGTTRLVKAANITITISENQHGTMPVSDFYTLRKLVGWWVGVGLAKGGGRHTS